MVPKYDKTLDRYYFTFEYEEGMDVRLPHVPDCPGQTKATDIQIEKNFAPTKYTRPLAEETELSGVFKLVSDLQGLVDFEVGRLDESDKVLTGLIQHTNREIKLLVQEVSSMNNEMLRKAEVKIDADGIQLGAGKVVDGNTIASLMIVEPESITAITKLMRITGDLIVGGTIEGKHIRSSAIDTGHLRSGSVTSDIVEAGAIKGKHLYVDYAMINKLGTNELLAKKIVASKAFVAEINAIKIDTTFLHAYQGEIGGFQFGFHPHDKEEGRWITGADSFAVGMSNGAGESWKTALWVNWGGSWDTIGYNAWYVLSNGKMYCNNEANFGDTIAVKGLTYLNGGLSVKKTSTFHETADFNNGVNLNGKVMLNHRDLQRILDNKANTWDIPSNSRYNVYSYFFKSFRYVYSGGNYIYFDGRDGKTNYWVKVTIDGSDKRYKSNIKQAVVPALDRIMKLGTYSYHAEFPNEKPLDREVGLIAQEVEEHIPDAHQVLPNGVHTWKPFELIPYLVKAIQELNMKVEELENGRENGCNRSS